MLAWPAMPALAFGVWALLVRQQQQPRPAWLLPMLRSLSAYLALTAAGAAAVMSSISAAFGGSSAGLNEIAWVALGVVTLLVVLTELVARAGPGPLGQRTE